MFKMTDLAALKKKFEELDDYAIHRMNNMTRIWGFQFEATRSTIEKTAKENAATADDTPITVFGNVQLFEKCHLESDLTLFIYVFLKYRNLSSALGHAGPAAEILKKKFDLYKIESGTLPEHGLKYVNTLSRIARAFPVHTARLILTEKLQGVLTYSAFFKQELPLLMQHTIFPGLVPTKQFHNELKHIALVLNMEISVKLSRPDEKGDMMGKTVEELLTPSRKYMFDAIYSSLDPQDEKLEILTKAGILEVSSGGELQLSAATVALLYKLKGIRKLYSLKYSEAVNIWSTPQETLKLARTSPNGSLSRFREVTPPAFWDLCRKQNF